MQEKVIQAELENFPQENIETLIRSIPARIEYLRNGKNLNNWNHFIVLLIFFKT